METINKKIEISILEIKDASGTKYKATKRIPEMGVAETKFFSSENEAKAQMREWLQQILF